MFGFKKYFYVVKIKSQNEFVGLHNMSVGPNDNFYRQKMLEKLQIYVQ